MRRLIQVTAIAIVGFSSHAASAQETADAEAQAQGAEIISERLGNQSIEEYRISDRLRKMKIDPDDGPAYYLKDRSGDGRLDDSHDSMEDDVNLRKWRLGQW